MDRCCWRSKALFTSLAPDGVDNFSESELYPDFKICWECSKKESQLIKQLLDSITGKCWPGFKLTERMAYCKWKKVFQLLCFIIHVDIHVHTFIWKITLILGKIIILKYKLWTSGKAVHPATARSCIQTGVYEVVCHKCLIPLRFIPHCKVTEAFLW